MLDMVVGERRHRVIAMIVIRLVPNIDTLYASVLGGLFEVLGEELALFVEVVAGSLDSVLATISYTISWGKGTKHTTSISTSKFPFHFFTNSVASCSLHFSAWSSPKYPENAFWPHWQLIGLEIGAKADTDLYLPGLRRYFITVSQLSTIYPHIVDQEGR